MPTWGEMLTELKALEQRKVPAPLDVLRRSYLSKLQQLTGRNTILYCSKSGDIDSSINDEDIQAFMEVVCGLTGDGVDIILHSPGGSADAAEAIVCYLRSKFDNIRVIVPVTAMSAATMLACAADEIVMGKHSFLGPIDPQLVMKSQMGMQVLPAQAVLDQFDMAKAQCQDPKQLGAWLPMLAQYGPALLVQCDNAIKLSQMLVASWLEMYMFKGEEDASGKAGSISRRLADHKEWKSHGRHIPRLQAQQMGLKIMELEGNQAFQDAVLSIFHAASLTLNMSTATKIVENHLAKAFVKMKQQQMVLVQPGQPGFPPGFPPGMLPKMPVGGSQQAPS